jgi:uncharacterized OsmC-like protein
MTDTSRIKDAFERSVKVLSLRPGRGRATGTTKIRVREGLICDIESGPWRLVADMPVSAGGTATAPTPGVLGRAALGSCLAIGYIMRAAANNVPITGLEVEIQADSDECALYGLPGASPGYSELRYVVTVESNAPEEEVHRVLDSADAHSPYLAVFQRPQRCTRSVVINKSPRP